MDTTKAVAVSIQKPAEQQQQQQRLMTCRVRKTQLTCRIMHTNSSKQKAAHVAAHEQSLQKPTVYKSLVVLQNQTR
jgi:hypothetical protein